MNPDVIEAEDKKAIVTLLQQMAKTFDTLGLPKEQFVICSDPNQKERVQFFFTIYRSVGERHLVKTEVNVNERKNAYIQ